MTWNKDKEQIQAKYEQLSEIKTVPHCSICKHNGRFHSLTPNVNPLQSEETSSYYILQDLKRNTTLGDALSVLTAVYHTMTITLPSASVSNTLQLDYSPPLICRFDPPP